MAPFRRKETHARELHLKLPGLRPDEETSTLILHQQDVKEGWGSPVQPASSGQALHPSSSPRSPPWRSHWIGWIPIRNELSVWLPRPSMTSSWPHPVGGCATCPLPEPGPNPDPHRRRKSGQTIPGRITLTDDKGFLYPVHAEEGQSLALRPGVVYTGHGKSPSQVGTGLLPAVCQSWF